MTAATGGKVLIIVSPLTKTNFDGTKLPPVAAATAWSKTGHNLMPNGASKVGKSDMVEKKISRRTWKVNKMSRVLSVAHQPNSTFWHQMAASGAAKLYSSDSEPEDSEVSDSASSSSSEGVMVARPVYVKRGAAGKPAAGPRLQDKTALLLRVENQHKLDAGDAGDANDADDTDPAAEYAAWQLRERQRLQRDRAAMEEIETAKNDAVRSKLAEATSERS